MATSLSIKGGSALRARLENVRAVPVTFAQDWADETVARIHETKPHSDRPASNRFTTRVSRVKAGVYGAFWWIFVDRGTKAHDITARKAKVLRFQSQGQTIFAKRVHVGRIGRRPFISKASQESLHDLGGDAIIKAWNGRRRASHKRFL